MEGTIKPSFAKGTARRLNFISQEKSFRRLRVVVDSQLLLVAREKPQLKRDDKYTEGKWDGGEGGRVICRDYATSCDVHFIKG